MCGIAGIYNRDGKPVDASLVRAMAGIMTHRGPDDEGYLVEYGLGLGFRRLTVIDPQGGHQPMSNEDGTVWCVLNGEIYNFQQLRSRLNRHRFITQSDTEVIVHGYEEYGEHVVDHLHGMFALVIWDRRRRLVLLARDRMGIKPLYYRSDGNRLTFASELRAVLRDPEVPQNPDFAALDSFLSLRFVPAPQTVIQGVNKLPAGHLLRSDSNGISLRRYWAPEIWPKQGVGTSEWVNRITATLEESVRRHMVSDVPLGAFLSGGIDSSIVVALANRQMSQPIKTFTVGFPGDRRVDESSVARQVASALGTDHHELPLETRSLPLQTLKDIVWHMDEPLADPATIPLYMVSEFARTHVTVALSGDGGDELFAGYGKHLLVYLMLLYRRLPFPLRGAAEALLSRFSIPFLPAMATKAVRLSTMSELSRQRRIWPDTFTWQQRQHLYRSDVRDQILALGSEDPLTRLVLGSNGTSLETTLAVGLGLVLPEMFLMKTDRMSMAHGLEVRVPLLDDRLVELAFTIPATQKLEGFQTKALLRKVLGDFLPPGVTHRRKHYFSVPLGQWFSAEFDQYLRDSVEDSKLCRTLFRQEQLSTLLANGLNPRQAFSLLVLSLWDGGAWRECR